MELRLLLYFLAVAREETISGAAEFLHVTQPTLSRQMMDLEEALGVKLFNRGKRSITLTDEGMLLRKRAGEIVELVEKTQGEISTFSNNEISGDIHIGSGETHAMQMIGSIIKSIQVDFPQICFHLYSGNAEEVMERLDKGLLDFCLLFGNVNSVKNNSIRLTIEDTWGVLMRTDSPLAALDTIRPEHLWDMPLIVSRQRLNSNVMTDWLKKDYEKLNIVATYNLLYNASLLVKENVGYALCLDKIINTTVDSGLCFKPLEGQIGASMNLIWKKYQVFSNASELFLEKCKAYCLFE